MPHGHSRADARVGDDAPVGRGEVKDVEAHLTERHYSMEHIFSEAFQCRLTGTFVEIDWDVTLSGGVGCDSTGGSGWALLESLISPSSKSALASSISIGFLSPVDEEFATGGACGDSS